MRMRIVISYQGNEVVRSLANEAVLIGRGSGAEGPDLDLSPDLYVSRKHALLTERYGAIWIEDLDSKLGSRVNGKEIKGKGECRLHAGDVIEIGETVLRADLPTPPALSRTEARSGAADRIESTRTGSTG
jgi:pSer/pThr/pTyr-binding forkhead associated (FHA) protein